METKGLDTVSDISVEDFRTRYFLPGIPVIIRNGMEGSRSLYWTVEYLKEKCGDNIVHVRKNTKSTAYKVGQKYDIEQMKFSKLAQLLMHNSSEAEKYYLAASNIKTAFRQVKEEFVSPKYVEKVHHGPYLWVGSKGHYEFCHVDSDDGMLCMLKGEKKVRLFSPERFHCLYPNPLGSHGRTIQSSVNLDDPDYERFPLLKDAVCETGTLYGGDILFIPSFYWHQVSAIDASVSVNIFWGDAGNSDFVTKLINQKWDAFSYWMLNVMEQNRPILDSIMSDIYKVLSGFLANQFKDFVSKEELKPLVQCIMNHFGYETLPPYTGPERKHPKKLKIRGLLWRGDFTKKNIRELAKNNGEPEVKRKGKKEKKPVENTEIETT